MYKRCKGKNDTIAAMKEIMVSIVCTNYNKGDWIAEAIESFLNQKTDFVYEILVIDDGSSDHSPDVIREYAKKYPNIVRAFYNKKNLGITKTWIMVCNQARGKYIARCDGDDYWIDENKLKKQVGLLEKSKDSRWCSTDYDIISPEGALRHRSAFESSLVDRSTSYAQMLATKGFTMSSTWLVEADLMREINEELDTSAVDDTFNIQLDLFNKTKLTYLPEATVVYRVNEGSDSRPVEIDEIVARHGRLLKTQLEYIKKYKNIDYDKIIELILRRDMSNEMLAIERLKLIYQLREDCESQRAEIQQLQESIGNITRSKSYRLTASCARILKVPSKFTAKAVKKLFWLNGRRRYARYFVKNFPSASTLQKERESAENISYRPLISIIVPTYNTNSEYFAAMIDSVKKQTYDNWEVVFVDDASPDSTVRALIENEAKNDPRVVYKFLKTNRHISGATNEGFMLAKGEFVSLLDHDDVLHPSALHEVVQAINKNKQVDFIYTDEDKVDENGRHTDPFIKPDWNEELLYSVNYITHFTTIRKTIVDKIGGEIGIYNGAQDWDLFLRATNVIDPKNIIHIPKILYSWRIHNSSTAKNLETKPYVFEAQRKLLEDNLKRRGFNEGEFSIQKNKFMGGAWDVSYKNQDITSLHRPGQPVEYGKIKGLAMTKSQIIRNFGHESLVTKLYKYCQYRIDSGDSRSSGA